MAAPAPPASPVGPDTLITVKVLYNDINRRFKIPLKDLGARVLPQKVCPSRSSDRSSSFMCREHPSPIDHRHMVHPDAHGGDRQITPSSLFVDLELFLLYILIFNWPDSSASCLPSRRISTSSLNVIPTAPQPTSALTAITLLSTSSSTVPQRPSSSFASRPWSSPRLLRSPRLHPSLHPSLPLQRRRQPSSSLLRDTATLIPS